MKYYFLLIILMIGFVSGGVQICIDLDDPSPPSSLSVSGDASSRVLGWGASVDTPSCSGIDEYVISRKGVEIGRVAGDVLTFVDSEGLSVGSYIYSVYAIDLIGRNGGIAIANEFTIAGNTGPGGSSGGSSSTSYICTEDWECGEWSECLGNDMRRLCNDLNECGTEKSKPDIYQECGESSGVDDMTVESSLDGGEIDGIGGFFSAITGAVIGGGATSVAAAGIFLVLVLGGLTIVIRRRNFRK